MSDIKRVIEQFIKDTSVSPLLNKPQDVVETQMRAARIRAAIPKILRAFYEGTSSLEEIRTQLEELKAEWDAFECECTGNPENPSPSGNLIFDSDYHILGQRDYINTIYTTRFDYIRNTSQVYVNGVRLTRGLSYDYIELGNRKVELTFPLFPTDNIGVNYLTSLESGNISTDYNYDITGVRNSVNTTFYLRKNYVAQTTQVFLNGMKLTRGIDYDYIEGGGRRIDFNFAPASTDLITVDYKSSELIFET